MKRLVLVLAVFFFFSGLPAVTVMGSEGRVPIEPTSLSIEDLIFGVLILGAGWFVADIAFRAVNGRAPTGGQRIVWTILIIFGGAVLVSVLRQL